MTNDIKKIMEREAKWQPRWPSTYSISKILHATGASIADFCKMIQESEESCKN